LKILLDTHVWLWLEVSPENLSSDALKLLSDTEHELILSAASTWEIAIKFALGKLPLPMPPAKFALDSLANNDFTPLFINHSHSLQVADLARHHNDPFDRLLIAQAQLDDLTILTADKQFSAYDVKTYAAT